MTSSAPDTKLLERFRKYQDMFPEAHEDKWWSAVAESFDLEGDGARTVAALKQAILANPEWGRWQLELAKAQLRSKKYMEAIVALDRCAELDASGCDTLYYAESVLYYLGYALFGAGRFKEAAEAWRGAETSISSWGDPHPLKDFHLHRGWAHHLERNLLDALEAYRRGMVAPGPGDSSEDDVMDEDTVEESQSMNENIEKYYALAKRGLIPDAASLIATPYTG